MNVDLDRLRAIVAQDYAIAIEGHYAESGMTALRRLGPALDQIHEQLAYELMPNGLCVLASLDPAERLLGMDGAMPVTPDQLSALVRGAATIEVLRDGGLVLLPEAIDPPAFADRAVVYLFDDRDYFIVGEQSVAVPNPTNFPSVWGTPTFFDLQHALEHYRDRIALHCQCRVLATVWHDPDRRWLLKNKPERTMQESLHQFLVSTLRTHKKVEVRREQPVGERKPPDLKVTWTLTNRIAFIEVKWMGASVHASEQRVSWSPDEAEANAGATQLVGYLTDNEQEAAHLQTMGFLVVFDARRRGVAFGTDTLSHGEATFFLARDVTYAPDYAQTRHDFAPPLRFFMFPLQPAA